MLFHLTTGVERPGREGGSSRTRIKGEKCFQLVFERDIYGRNYLFKH